MYLKRLHSFRIQAQPVFGTSDCPVGLLLFQV